jgi:hypothetical protein
MTIFAHAERSNSNKGAANGRREKIKGRNEDVELNDEVLEDVSGGADQPNIVVNGNPNINIGTTKGGT